MLSKKPQQASLDMAGDVRLTRTGKIKIVVPPVLRNPPYGLMIVNKEYVINILEMEMIQIIMDLTQQGWKPTEITRFINKDFGNRKDEEIDPEQVRRIIKREFLNKSLNDFL
jgi:hypothetical protein